MQAAAQLGYRHNHTASRLALRRTRLLGVTMEPYSTLHDELVEELQAAATEHGYDMVISTISRTQDEHQCVVAGGYLEDAGAHAAQVLLAAERHPSGIVVATIGAPSAYSTLCSARASPPHAQFPSSATTTAFSPGSQI
jgi:DNA-binding LacI/PurR family transcriptional regulator